MDNGKTIPVITRREQIGRMRLRSRRERRITGTLHLAATGLGAGAVLSWLLMILTGIVHGSWWHLVPTLGYGTAFLITGMLFVMGVAVQAFVMYIERI